MTFLDLGSEPVDVFAIGTERRFVAMQRGGDLGVGVGGLGELRTKGRQALVERVALAHQHGGEQVARLRFVLAVAIGGIGLALERAQRALEFTDDVVESLQVAGGVLELEFGEPLAGLVAGDAGRFLDQLAALLGLAGEHRFDLALADHRVGADAETGVHQQVLDLSQRHHLVVEAVLALAGAEDPPADQELAVLGVLEAGVGGQLEADLRHAERTSAL